MMPAASANGMGPSCILPGSSIRPRGPACLHTSRDRRPLPAQSAARWRGVALGCRRAPNVAPLRRCDGDRRLRRAGQQPHGRRRALAPALIDDVRRFGHHLRQRDRGRVGSAPPDAAFVQAVMDIEYWESQIDAHPDVLARIRTAADIDAAKNRGPHRPVVCVPGRRLVRGRPVATGDVPSPRRARDPADLQPPQPARRRLPGAGQCGVEQGRRRGRRAHERARHPRRSQPLRAADGGGRDQGTSTGPSPSRTPVAARSRSTPAIAPTRSCGRSRRRAASRASTSCRTWTSASRPRPRDVVRHIEHAVEVAGEDHVSIGTDGGISAEVRGRGVQARISPRSRARGAQPESLRPARRRRATCSRPTSTLRAGSKPWPRCCRRAGTPTRASKKSSARTCGESLPVPGPREIAHEATQQARRRAAREAGPDADRRQRGRRVRTVEVGAEDPASAGWPTPRTARVTCSRAS